MTIAEVIQNPAAVQIPLVWVLGMVGSLATVVTVLAKILWGTVNRQIDALTKQIDRMQKRIDVLQRGCGITSCAWRVQRAHQED